MKLLDKGFATDVIAHDTSPVTVHTDPRAYGKLGWGIVLVGVLGFVAWGSLAPLEKGVPVSATVVKEGNRKMVQHLTGGVIQDILVHDGDTVKAGQVLVRMNDVVAKSTAETSRAQYVMARLAEARLLTERDGLAGLVFPATLKDLRNDPRVQENLQLQQQLLTSRRAALQSELAATDENLAGLKLQADGVEQSRDSKKEQLALLKEQLDGMRSLAHDGYIARNRLLEQERMYAQISGAIAEDTGNIGRARRQIAELMLRRAQRTQEYQREVRTQLADTQREAEALQSRLQALDYEVANADVKSPADGVVVGSNIFTRGGVVGAGAHLMDVVPTDDGLVVEGELAVNLVDRVHPGLPVELIFAAFNTNKTPHIPGQVIQVAADRTVNERNGAAYYKMRAKVTPEGAKLIAQHQLTIRPGMPVELFVKTGERTMMNYLLKPIFDRAKGAMAEE